MKPEKYRRGQALRVLWVDSTQRAGWLYDEHPPVHVEEVVTQGFVVNQSPKGLNITSTISEAGGVLSLVTIPWECITDIQDIEDWGRYPPEENFVF
jgi:hypothetical protein